MLFLLFSEKDLQSKSRVKTEPNSKFISTQWEIHQQFMQSFDSQYSSNTKSSENIASISDTKEQRRKSQPLLLEMSDKSKSAHEVNFNIIAHSASGGQKTSLESNGTFFAREVEPNFTLKQRKDSLIDASIYLGAQIAKSSAISSLMPVFSDEHVPIAISNELAINCTERKTDILNYAFDRIWTLCEKNGANAEQKKLAQQNFEKVSAGYFVIGLADNSGIRNVSKYTKSEASRASEDERILNSNIELASQNGSVPAEHLGVSSGLYVFYDSQLWASGLDQLKLHSFAVSTYIQNGAYPKKGEEKSDQIFETQMQNLKVACDRYGTSLDASLQIAHEDLKSVYSDMQRLTSKIMQLANANGGSTQSIEAAYLQLMSDSQFESELNSLQTRLSELTFKYPIARRFGPGGTDEGKYTPESIASQVSKDFMSKDAIPGYMALDYAMSWIGRGMFVMPPPKAQLQEIEYITHNSDSKLFMDSVDGVTQNTGYISSFFTVRVYDNSLVSEYPQVMQERIRQAVNHANLSNAGVHVQDVKLQSGDNYTDYIVEIRAPFSFYSETQITEFSKEIFVPSSIYDPNSVPLKIYEVEASVSKTQNTPTQFKKATTVLPGWWDLKFGLTALPIFGTSKSFLLGTTNVTTEEQLGQRNWSTLGITQIFDNYFGYEKPSSVNIADTEYYRSYTYLFDRLGNPSRFSSTAQIPDILKNELGMIEKNGSFFLDDFDILTLDNIFEKYQNEIYSKYASQGIDDVLASDPDAKNIPSEIFKDMDKLKSWSPLHYELNKWSMLSALYSEALYRVDPDNTELKKLLTDRINFLEAQRILVYPKTLTPTNRKASALYANACNALVQMGEAIRENGLTFNYNWSEDSRLALSISTPQMLGGVFNPYIGLTDFGLSAKITDSYSAVINAHLNLYKKTGNDSIFKVDFAGELGFLYSPTTNYETDVAVFGALANIENVFYVSEDKKSASTIQSAVIALKSKLIPSRDADEIAICNEILKYSNPGSTDYDINTGGQCDREIQKLRNRLYSQKKFSGGTDADANILSGLYMNGLNTYHSFDNLGTGLIPFGHIRFPVYFEQKNLFGSKKEGEPADILNDITLRVNADVHLPPALYLSIAKLFVDKGSVSDYVLQGADMYTKNWVPAIPFCASLSKTLALSTDWATIIATNISGNLTSMTFNEVSLSADFRTDALIPGAISAFKLTTGLEGTGIGSLDFTTHAHTAVYNELYVFGLHSKLQANLFSMLKQAASSTSGNTWLANVGVSIGFSVDLGSSGGRKSTVNSGQNMRNLDMYMPSIPRTTPRSQYLDATPTKEKEPAIDQAPLNSKSTNDSGESGDSNNELKNNSKRANGSESNIPAQKSAPLQKEVNQKEREQNSGSNKNSTEGSKLQSSKTTKKSSENKNESQEEKSTKKTQKKKESKVPEFEYEYTSPDFEELELENEER